MDNTDDQEEVIEEVIVEDYPEANEAGTAVPDFCSVREALNWFAYQRAFFEEFGMDTRVDLDQDGQVSLLVGRERNKVWLQPLSEAFGLKITDASDDEFIWRLVEEDLDPEHD